MRDKLVDLLVASDGRCDPQSAARELFALHQVSPDLAVKLLRSAADSDPHIHVSHRRVAYATEPLRSCEFAVMDVETTGLSADVERLTEIGVVIVRGDGEILREESWLINPGMRIPWRITALTGISDRLVADAPPAAQVLPRARALLRGRTVVAHNAAFDSRFFAAALHRAGQNPLDAHWLCTRLLTRRLVPGLSSYGLDHLQGHFQVDNTARHRALGDARATARILARLINLASGRGHHTVSDLLALSKQRADKRSRRSPTLHSKRH